MLHGKNGAIEMRVLLTGSTGFLGSHLLLALLKEKYEVIILKRSFSDFWRIEKYMPLVRVYDTDKTVLEEMFSVERIDVIIHLATDYGRKSTSDAESILKSNIAFPTQLLQLCVKHGVKVFINADTSTPTEYTLYSATKKAFLNIGRYHAANYSIQFVNMVMEYIYGENDDGTGLVSLLFQAITAGNKINASLGEQKRDFVYVGDVVAAYMKLLESLGGLTDTYTEFSIGSGQSISLRKFVEITENVSGKKVNVQWGAIPYRKNELFDIKADISKAEKYLTWQPETSLESGTKRTIDWYEKKNR